MSNMLHTWWSTHSISSQELFRVIHPQQPWTADQSMQDGGRWASGGRKPHGVSHLCPHTRREGRMDPQHQVCKRNYGNKFRQMLLFMGCAHQLCASVTCTDRLSASTLSMKCWLPGRSVYRWRRRRNSRNLPSSHSTASSSTEYFLSMNISIPLSSPTESSAHWISCLSIYEIHERHIESKELLCGVLPPPPPPPPLPVSSFTNVHLRHYSQSTHRFSGFLRAVPWKHTLDHSHTNVAPPQTFSPFYPHLFNLYAAHWMWTYTEMPVKQKKRWLSWPQSSSLNSFTH